MGSAPDVLAAVERIRARTDLRPEAALVLGSGLGALADAVEDPVTVPFGAVPGWPDTDVASHAGQWTLGRLAGRPVVVQAGRFHAYEGHGPDVLAAPVRVAARLGAGRLLLTNAAGGVDPSLEPGDVVLVRDHIDLMFRPSPGPTRRGDQRAPDRGAPYDPGLAALAERVASGLGVRLRSGVYAAVTGPSYETAAEVRMLRRLGADVVGMSTVPEVVVARALGMRVLALSMVTNKATGLSAGALSHDEVVEAGATAAHVVGAVLAGVLQSLPDASRLTGAK